MKRRRALAAEFVSPEHHRGPVSRQTTALAGVVLAVVFGGLALKDLGNQSRDIWIVAVLVACVGVVAGALYHRVRRFWWQGAVSGGVVALGAFGADRGYSLIRAEALSLEFAVIAALGGVPGVLLYRWLMAKQVVTDEDLESGGRGSRRTRS